MKRSTADDPGDGDEAARQALGQVPRKRSVTIAGHPTSLRLEPMFWTALEAAAVKASLPLNALIARIDAARLEAGGPNPLNLASAIRVWLYLQR